MYFIIQTDSDTGKRKEEEDSDTFCQISLFVMREDTQLCTFLGYLPQPGIDAQDFKDFLTRLQRMKNQHDQHRPQMMIYLGSGVFFMPNNGEERNQHCIECRFNTCKTKGNGACSRIHFNLNDKFKRDFPSARLHRQLEKTFHSQLFTETPDQPSLLHNSKQRLRVTDLENQAFSREDHQGIDAKSYDDPCFTGYAKCGTVFSLAFCLYFCDSLKPLFESTKLDKSELNKASYEMRPLRIQVIRNTGRECQQKQKRALLHGTKPSVLLSCKLLLTKAFFIRVYKEYVRNNLNSLNGKEVDAPEEIIPEYEVCTEKEDDQIIQKQEEQENGEDVITIHHMQSDHAPENESDGSECYIDNASRSHCVDVTDTGCNYCCLLMPCFVWSSGIYCQEEGSESVDRYTNGNGWGSSEKDSGTMENYTADGSASTAVNESSCDEIKEAVLSSESDKLENVGNNGNVSDPLSSSKASTVPVTEELLAEKKEALARSRSKENEENLTFLKKNTDDNKSFNQNENQKQIDVGDSQMLQRFYRLRSVGQHRHQFFVYMLRSSQAVHVPRQGFENEMCRLATYVNFQPPAGVYVIRLANAGFFLPTNNPQNTGALNVLQMVLECAFCGVLVEVLKFQGRQPTEVHVEASPSCPLVLGQDGRNVSIAQMAQTTGAHFLDNYPSPTAGALPYGGVTSRSNCEEYAIDGDGSTASSAFSRPESLGGKDNAAEKPAIMSVPAQAAIVCFTAVGQGQTVADARGLPSTQPLPCTGPALPRQTATFASSANCTSLQPSSVAPGDAAPPAGTTQPSSPSREVENSGEGTGSSTQERQVVTYEQLGIFAQRPKRPDMAVVATRMTTFEGWPHAGSHPPSEMAEAGFYYTGQADLVRCFYCRGGLRTWERSDHAWVEHGRWFPRCPFVRLCRGQKFVDAIQKLNENGASNISEEDVKREILSKEEEAKRNRPAAIMPPPPSPPTSGKADDDRGAVGGATTSIRADYTVGDGNDVAALSRRLEEENQELKETALCKMCQQREVNVLFLPCGHLVACAHCAPALRVCAICRQQVKGSVRVLLDEEEDPTD